MFYVFYLEINAFNIYDSDSSYGRDYSVDFDNNNSAPNNNGN